MNKTPFQLSIKSSCRPEQTELLACTSLLRVVPGSRHVYDAVWNDRQVIVKLFSHKINANRHLQREWKGLNELQKLGLNAPAPLFFGKTEDGTGAVVMQKIENASTVLDVLNGTTDQAERFDLLGNVLSELAKQHSKGVLQKDLHLGNFLLSGDKIFTIDPSQIKFYRREVTKKESMSQLALLMYAMPGCDTESAIKLCGQYVGLRGWEFGNAEEELFGKYLVLHKKRGIRGGLKKCLRTNKRELKIKSDKFTVVFDRVFCEGAEPFDFIKQIDELMDNGQILKDGNTCYVSRLNWNGKDVVVKRYNNKGYIHSVRHTIQRSRARRCWLNGHRLEMLQIATPRPCAYIEECRGLLVWKSYIVTEFVAGRKLHFFLRDDNVTKEQRSKIISRVGMIFDALDKHRITHGDMKHSNILVTDNGAVLTDLDSMKVHKCNCLYKIYRAKDIAHMPAD